MAKRFDAIVVGAGHNGLTTAAYLAKAGRSVLVLERRERVGGILDTVELAPGVRAPGIVHTVGRLRKSVISDLGLVKQGLATVEPEVRVFAPQPEGPPLTLWADAARTAAELRERSAVDAEAYPAFDRKVRSLASFLAYLHAITPPDVKDPSLADALNGVKLGNAFRRLGKRPGREATRALPMAIADYVAEAFESDAVRGAIASRAVQYTAMGPWSAGTTAVLLADSAGNDGGAPGQSTLAARRPGRARRGARERGPWVRRRAPYVVRGRRDPGRAPSRDRRGARRRLRDRGARGRHRRSTPSARSRRCWTRSRSGRTCAGGPTNIRTPGSVSKVDLALSGLPSFDGTEPERLAGRIVDRAVDRSPRAGVRRLEVRRDRGRPVPGGDDPDALGPDARAGGDARDERR